MKEKTKIARYGRSAFVRVPSTAMNWFGLEVGQEVDMEFNDQGQMIVNLKKGPLCDLAIPDAVSIA